MKTAGTFQTSQGFLLKILPVFLILVGLCSIYAFSDDPSNDDPIKSYRDRTDELMKKMTVEEKVAQMLCVWQTRDSLFDKNKHVVATLKHMAGHGQPSGGMNISPANLSERTMREVFLYPFKKIVEEAHVMGIMASYNEVNGVPSHANKWMFRDVLRGEWGFNGYVVSDYYALRELNIREGMSPAPSLRIVGWSVLQKIQ